MKKSHPTVILLTCFVILCFALNSFFTRLAIGKALIDPFSFALVRAAAGFIALAIYFRCASRLRTTRIAEQQNEYRIQRLAAWMIYAVGFSFAFTRLDTGVGALSLFAASQLFLIVADIRTGNTLQLKQWIGVAVALIGLLVLTLPGAGIPSYWVMSMSVAGLGWGWYTYLGKFGSDHTRANYYAFRDSIPLFLIPVIFVALNGQAIWNPWGVMIAVVCGGVTTALGYTLWYVVVKRFWSPTEAGVWMLSVPGVAGFLGLLLLSDKYRHHLIASFVIVSIGISIALFSKDRAPVERS